MTRQEIEARWGMPVSDIAKDIAAQGLSILQAAQVFGVHKDTLIRLLSEDEVVIRFERVSIRSAVSLREGMPFWQYVSLKVDEGKSRKEVAALVGQSYKGFMHTMEQNPDLDPFPCHHVARAWLLDTGETIVAACKRMAKNGLSLSMAARVIGYKHRTALRDALESRGAFLDWHDGRKRPRVTL